MKAGARAPAALLLLATALAGCSAIETCNETTAAIPVLVDTGRPGTLEARVCRPPPGAEPPRVVVFNHGAPAGGGDPGLLRPLACDSEPARWFLARNFVVVAGLRRGFGASTGPVRESAGACADPDFVAAGRESARDVAAIVRYALALPGVRSDGAVVVGQSTGGWATVAYDAVAEPDVSLLVDMSGGRTGPPGVACGAGRLVAAAGEFGAHAGPPMLWVYAQNDSYFPPAVAAAMHARFVAAGGHADFALTGKFGREGHGLFEAKGGSKVWGPILEAHLGEAPPHAMSALNDHPPEQTP